MRLAPALLPLVIGLSLACGGASSTPATPPASSTSPAPTTPAPSPKGRPSPPPAAPSAWTAPALPVCDPARLLVTYDYVEIQKRYCELCQAHDDMACTLDWPSSDVPLCKRYDEFRNSIYAYYGYPFTSAEWKNYYAGVSWYKADPNFTDARMSEAAKRNVALLKSKADKKQDCIDEG